MMRAVSYIARKDDFQKALTDQGELKVVAVYPDGSTQYDHLAGWIQSARADGYGWRVHTSHTKDGHEITLILL